MFGNVDTGGGVGRTRTARHHGNAGASGETGCGIRHHDSAAFLAADGYLDLGIMQGIQHGKIAFTRHAKNMLGPLCMQGIHNELATCTFCCHRADPYPKSLRGRLDPQAADEDRLGCEPSSKTSGARLKESLQARDGAAKDQRMDVMRAFIGVDRFQILGVAHDVIFLGNPIAAMHVAGLTGNVEGLAAIVAFDNRNHFGRQLAVIKQPAYPQRTLQAE